jgi:hypothetical protein
VKSAPFAESLLKKEDRVKGVSRKISVDPICEDVELAPRELDLLVGGREKGQVPT